MKLFISYLKQNGRVIAAFALFTVLFAVSFVLYRLPLPAVIYPAGLSLVFGLVFLIAGFLRAKKRHETFAALNELTATQPELLPPCESIDDSDYRRIIELLADSRAVLCGDMRRSMDDMLDYYTVWAHQIKTPISAMRLTLQNEDSDLARRLLSDLGRIEQYVEMVMAYLRLGSSSTDYVIRETELDVLIRRSVKKFAGEFIQRRIALEFVPTQTSVLTDEKWLAFVIEQVLSNALKYTRTGSIGIYLEQPKTLCIRDTGIGIAPEDLPRIFEKGYTGYNGRTDKGASGLGLYLCRSVCRNLGHEISAESVLGEGTTVRIDLSSYDMQAE